MATAIKPPLTVEISEDIRRDAKLLEAVNIATQQLEDFLHDEKFEFDRYEIHWSRNRRAPGEICADYTEWDHYGERSAGVSIPVSRLYDPILRNSVLRDLRLQALSQFSRQIGKSLDKKIAILIEEEQQNGDQ